MLTPLDAVLRFLVITVALAVALAAGIAIQLAFMPLDPHGPELAPAAHHHTTNIGGGEA